MMMLFFPFVGVQAGTPERSENRTMTSTVDLYHYPYCFDLIIVHIHVDSIHVCVHVGIIHTLV